MVRGAVGITALGRQEVQPAHGTPPQGEREVARGTALHEPLRLGDDMGHHDPSDGVEGHRLRRRRGRRLRSGLCVVVGMGDDEAATRHGQHRDMPPHGLVVEGRLLVDQVGHDLVSRERGLDHIADQCRVVAGTSDRRGEVLREGPLRVLSHASHGYHPCTRSQMRVPTAHIRPGEATSRNLVT
jgi:hypothetical protein